MTIRYGLVCTSLVLMATFALPATAAGDAAATEKEILRLEQGWNAAYAANDLPKYFSYYTEDPVLIFYNKRTTLAEYRKMWTEAVKTEPLESGKMSDVKILVGPAGDSAVASYQFDLKTGHPDGKSTSEHAFETDIWFKRDGNWRICAVHYSTQATPK